MQMKGISPEMSKTEAVPKAIKDKPILVDPKFPRITKKLVGEKYLYSINGRRMVRGKWIGERRTAWTEADARKEADTIRKKNDLKYNAGKYGHETIVFVHKAEEKLKKYGLPIEKALDEYLHFKEVENRHYRSKPIEKVWDDFINEHKTNGSSEHTIRTYEYTKRIMVNNFGGGTPIGLLAEKQIVLGEENVVQRFFKSKLSKYHPNSRLNIKRNFNAFFNYCFRQKYIEQNENPCLRIELKPIKKDPSVLSVDDAELLLRLAEENDKGLVPYIALMIFGGLRPTEASFLNSQNIDLENNQILISRSISKVRRGRTFDLNLPLLNWLKQYPTFYKVNYRKRMDKIKQLAGFLSTDEKEKTKVWESDICRHTAITFFLAKNNYQYGYAANQFGNSESVIRSYYESFKRPSKSDVDRFYNILPLNNKNK
ncbi:hypothetical protein EBU94_04100 [bacterium]|nr:hypothetical protein [bacterium]